MKEPKLYSHSQHLAEWNAGTADPNGAKSKRKTVYIKLHPKPNAPRHPALKPAHAPLQPR